MKTKGFLLAALKKAHDESIAAGGPAIPYSYKGLMKLEKLGLIKVQGVEYDGRPGITRLYTEEEIGQIVEKVKQYVLENQKNDAE